MFMKSTKMCVDFYDAINTEDILVSMIKRNSEKKKERKKKRNSESKIPKEASATNGKGSLYFSY